MSEAKIALKALRACGVHCGRCRDEDPNGSSPSRPAMTSCSRDAAGGSAPSRCTFLVESGHKHAERLLADRTQFVLLASPVAKFTAALDGLRGGSRSCSCSPSAPIMAHASAILSHLVQVMSLKGSTVVARLEARLSRSYSYTEQAAAVGSARAYVVDELGAEASSVGNRARRQPVSSASRDGEGDQGDAVSDPGCAAGRTDDRRLGRRRGLGGRLLRDAMLRQWQRRDDRHPRDAHPRRR